MSGGAMRKRNRLKRWLSFWWVHLLVTWTGALLISWLGVEYLLPPERPSHPSPALSAAAAVETVESRLRSPSAFYPDGVILSVQCGQLLGGNGGEFEKTYFDWNSGNWAVPCSGEFQPTGQPSPYQFQTWYDVETSNGTVHIRR